MKDEELFALFNGRGSAEIILRGLDIAQGDRITAVGFELGYDLREAVCVTRGQWRMIYVRNDTPEARLRVQGTLDRMRANIPVLPQVRSAAATANNATRLVTAEEAASRRRSITAYEKHGSASAIALLLLLGFGCLILAWLRRDHLGPASALAVVGSLLVVLACLTPGLMRRRYERNQRLVTWFEQSRTDLLRPPPPPPPPPDPGNQTGQGGIGS
ncbi:hypothetical protein ACWEJ7_26720 [Streptomyces albidoflavus]